MYANPRRIRARGKRLLRRRGELLERHCAHLYETGGLRRAHVRGHENVLKRLLVHASAFNLGLWMRRLFGVGTPRALQGRALALRALLSALWLRIDEAIVWVWARDASPTAAGQGVAGSLEKTVSKLAILVNVPLLGS